MRVLVTSARMPFALAVMRRLSEAGHEVFSSDTYDAAPGNHSRYVTAHAVTASCRVGEERGVNRCVTGPSPGNRRTSDRHASVDERRGLVVARVHDKHSFERLVEELGIRAPEGVTVRSDEELRTALERWPRWFGRGVYSRGGVTLLTNTGPLAGHVKPEDVHPTPDAPWLVQEFVDGPMVCTYSTLHGGRVTAHCTYRGPRQYHHSTAVQFESVDGSESLEAVRKLGEALGYTGQMSLDFVGSDDGLVIIECNPRTTDGVLLMEGGELAGALLDPEQELSMVPPGRITQLDLAVIGAMFSDGLRDVPGSIHDLLHIPGADRGWHDELPNLYSFLAFCHHERLSLREHQKLQVAMYEDVSWDGEPIDGMTPEQPAALAALHS